MFNNNSVLFKGKKNGIIILLDSTLPFDLLKDKFQQKVIEAKKFFEGSKTSITFQGRTLSEAEEQALLDIISVESGLSISFVENQGHTALAPTEELFVPTTFDVLENMTYYHRGSIRSGQSVRYAGSVVIIGDVNPGGEVIAEGNITILGTLKGLVHAGCAGNTDCFVSAYHIQPIQLRIADIISYIPNEPEKKQKNKNKNKFEPSMAYIQEGKIYIAPLL